jgi:serine/threonine protein kinase
MTPSMVCPKCSAQIPEESRFCLSCGQLVSSLSQAPTAAAESPAAQMAPAPVGRLISSDSLPVGGFTPGMVLADRYRIIGLIGRGGMGEIYRADDLKLGQPVALKFLPKALADDPVRRERLFAEVRIARQVSHPNICRVYDIGEIDGRHFLTMEYIDGEDLASLLKRIGNLHGTKALDVARQLCAGLAAAHDKGVLHRDLKPANVMIDGRGRVRVTDFGLAVAAGEEISAEDVSGTPPYMAPEQFAGKGASVRSDIYALGLIFYELFSGRRAFEEKTLAELRAKKETSSPTAPSEIARDIDPIIERVILRCIDKDPRQRPASAAQVAAALPGGDPLAAAIAAGETPSPEMVAASGPKAGLRPGVAWGILAFIIIGSIAILAINDRFSLLRRIPFEKSPEALVELSRQLLHKVGYSERFADSAYGFTYNSNLLNYIETSEKSWKNLDAKAILFWYRQSPRLFSVPPDNIFTGSEVTRITPPLQFSGEALVVLDAEGHLVNFRGVPLQVQSSSGTAPAINWTVFFDEAGLDISKWKPAEAKWSPISYADTRVAWEGVFPNRPGTPVWIEAAALQGRPISFDIIGPWVSTKPMEIYQQGTAEIIQTWVFNLSLLALIVGGIVFARRNLRLGRGDRRNAIRLALIVLGLTMLGSTLSAHHISTSGEIVLLILYAGRSLFWACLFWVLYMAIEPFVRRRWPQILVSWTRLLSGDWRDPLVMRDAFVGCAFGVLWICISRSAFFLPPSWFGGGAFVQRYLFGLGPIIKTRFFISAILNNLSLGILYGLGLTALFFLIWALLRNQKAAIVLTVVIWALLNPVNGLAISLALSALYLFVLMRFGLVAAVLDWFVMDLFLSFPITLNASEWYAVYGFACLGILAAIVLYAFHASLGGQPMFGRVSLED